MNWTLGRRPALDGVRGLAILMVMANHTLVPHSYGGGPIGVTVFFVLSGFLISALLLTEHDRTGSVSFRRFYERRVRRLLPAAVAAIAANVVASFWFGGWFLEWQDIPPALFYYANWVLAFSPGDALGALGGYWSLSIEEQFYILWPLVLLALMRRGRTWVIAGAAAGVALSLLDRAVLWSQGASFERIYYGSDTVAASLLAGCLLAAVLAGRPERRPSPVLAWVGAALILGAALGFLRADRWASVVATVGTVLVIWAVARGPADYSFWWLSNPVIRWFGERSYGLYLWHISIAWVLRSQTSLSWPEIMVLTFASSCAIAELSYRYLESPFRRRPQMSALEPTLR